MTGANFSLRDNLSISRMKGKKRSGGKMLKGKAPGPDCWTNIICNCTLPGSITFVS